MTTTPHAELLTDEDVQALVLKAGYNVCSTDTRADFISGIKHAERALLARLGEQQPVAWGVFDSQGFYEVALGQVSAEEYAAYYNAREKDDPLKPYRAAPLYARPPAAQPVAQGEREAFVEWLSSTYAWTREQAEYAWDDKSLYALVWQERAARSAAQGAAQVPADLRERLGMAHDASLDDEHRECRAILMEIIRLLDAAAPSPAGERTSTEGE